LFRSAREWLPTARKKERHDAEEPDWQRQAVVCRGCTCPWGCLTRGYRASCRSERLRSEYPDGVTLGAEYAEDSHARRSPGVRAGESDRSATARLFQVKG